jgi:transcriptional regulator with XRE-family HTH domain
MPKTTKRREINPEALAEKMRGKGWTKYRLAEESGVSRSLIGRYLKDPDEPGDRRGKQPQIETVEALCRALDCTIMDITRLVDLETEGEG